MFGSGVSVGDGVIVGVGGIGVSVLVGTGVSVGVEIDIGVQETRTNVRIAANNILDFILLRFSIMQEKSLAFCVTGAGVVGEPYPRGKGLGVKLCFMRGHSLKHPRAGVIRT
jgi:hypothetical protein